MNDDEFVMMMMMMRGEMLTDAESCWFNDGGRRTGAARLYLAVIKPVTDNSVLEIIILIADVNSNNVQ